MENEKTFEVSLQELEKVVKSLENKDLPLEEAVSLYTKGLELSQNCYKILNENEKLILQKMTENGLEKLDEER